MLWLLALVPAVCGLALFATGAQARTVLAMLGGLVLATTFGLAASAQGWSATLPWSDALVLGAALPPAAWVMAMLVPAIALPVVLYAAAHEDHQGLGRLVALMLLFVGGMQLLVIAADLLTLLIGWEIVGACSWALIGHEWRRPDAAPSGLYAFVMTRLGDLGLFLAAMAAYAGSGSLAYDDLGGPWLPLVAFGVLLSAAAKSGQAPFAPWLFRAMAGPTSVSALLHAATMVAAGAYLLIRLQPTLTSVPGFDEAAIAIGLSTALAGGIVACLQPHAKKLLAASTSAHYGLMLVAVGAGYPDVALAHLVAHAAFKALLFLAAGAAGERAGTFALHRLGLGRALPAMGFLSAVGAFALAGLPPLGAAWTKEEIVAAAGHVSPWLAVGVMVAGGLSAAYAMRFQVLTFKPRDDPPPGRSAHRLERLGAVLLALMTLGLSVLWLPEVHAGVDLAKGSIADLIASLLLVAVGLLTGRVLARRLPVLGTSGAPATLAAWLGLPGLFAWMACGFTGLATWAAWLDDAVLDAVPRAVGGLGRVGSAVLAASDSRAVDGGVRATAAFAEGLARLGDRIGEVITDGLPEGTARLVAISGADARRLHSGLSHHYYALIAGGAVALIFALIVLS